MPAKAHRPCTKPGCPAYATKGSRCDAHQPESGWTQWGNRSPERRRELPKGWRTIRETTLMRDDYLCQPCRRNGKLTEAAEVDHIVPRSQGGGHTGDNLEAICAPCHKKKTQSEAAQGRQGGLKVES